MVYGRPVDTARASRACLPLGGVGLAAALLGRRVLRQVRCRRAIHWSPAAGHLHRGTLTTRTVGDGPPLLLLHGLAGSGRFWGSDYDQLAVDRRLIVPDLLGFGDSPKPDVGYGPDDHADAVAGVLVELAGRRPAVVAAHSLGCVVALRLATRHPDLVSGIVGFGPPLYRDPDHARERLSNMGLLVRLFALGTPGAKAVCEWVCCAHPAAAATLARALRADLPGPIAEDGVRHSWTSYSETLRRVIMDAGGVASLRQVEVPVHLVAGDADPITDLGFLEDLTGPLGNVRLSVWSGGHDLPLTQPQECAEAIRGAFAHVG